ncbi:MAG: hypothetical protein JXA10_04465 [Anaerolineae bacterium]|nr:hypothetical protein [Anaerolineae bacterium]
MGRRALIVSLMLITTALILTACGDNDPAKTVDQGAELLTVTFDDAGAWEEGTFPAGDAPTATLAIRDGRYQIDHAAAKKTSFIWGEGGASISADAENVIIEVETEQLSAEKDNIYGVVCRLGVDARDNATGYALLISGDGHYGIAELRSDNLSFLLEWHQTDAIHQGQATNTIRAICVNDYLALYVNDTFLGDVTDTTYLRPGPVGLLAGVTAGEAVSMAFDNLTVYEGSLRD